MDKLRITTVTCGEGVRVDLTRNGELMVSGWATDLAGAVRALRRIHRRVRKSAKWAF